MKFNDQERSGTVTLESKVVITLDGAVAVGVPDAPISELKSALRLNFNSVRWT